MKFLFNWLQRKTKEYASSGITYSLEAKLSFETNFFVHCSLSFSHMTLVKSSLAILMGNFLSYNFAEDHFSIKCKEQKILISQVTSVL